MWIHWKHKKMRFTHKGSRILLRGIKPDTVSCRHVSAQKLQGLIRRKSVTHMVQLQKKVSSAHSESIVAAVTHSEVSQHPPEIQAVLDQFPQVFTEPTDLPPTRPCDHRIDLLPGPLQLSPCLSAASGSER